MGIKKNGKIQSLDDYMENILKGNECIKEIANDENYLYLFIIIVNDFSFRLLSGAIDMSLYNRDGFTPPPQSVLYRDVIFTLN